jgi:hypothetical protein
MTPTCYMCFHKPKFIQYIKAQYTYASGDQLQCAVPISRQITVAVTPSQTVQVSNAKQLRPRRNTCGFCSRL